MAQSAKRAPASFQKQTLFWLYSVLLHQPEQQLVHVFCWLTTGQQLVPEGQQSCCQKPTLTGAEYQNSISFPSPEHGCTSTVDQIREDDLLRTAADGVHPSDPFHLIRSLQLLGDAFGLLHLLDQPVEHGLRRFADLFEMRLQSPRQQHSRVDPVHVCAKIPPPRRCKSVFHTAPPFTFTVGGSFFIHILPQNAGERQCVRIRFADLKSKNRFLANNRSQIVVERSIHVIPILIFITRKDCSLF